jgi:hypothetical protein
MIGFRSSVKQVVLRWRPALGQTGGLKTQHFTAQVSQYLLDDQRILMQAMTFMLPPQTRHVSAMYSVLQAHISLTIKQNGVIKIK